MSRADKDTPLATSQLDEGRTVARVKKIVWIPYFWHGGRSCVYTGRELYG